METKRPFVVGDKLILAGVGAVEVLDVGLYHVALHYKAFGIPSATIHLTHKQAALRLRRPVDGEDRKLVLSVLHSSERAFWPPCFAARLRAIKSKLAEGCTIELAELVRDLGRREALSFTEKRLFGEARAQLEAELALTCDEPTAKKDIDDALSHQRERARKLRLVRSGGGEASGQGRGRVASSGE